MGDCIHLPIPPPPSPPHPSPTTSPSFCRSGHEIKVFSVIIHQTDQDSNKAEDAEKTTEEAAPAGEAEGAAEKAGDEAKPEGEEEKVGEEEKPASEVEGEEKPAEGEAGEAAGETEQATGESEQAGGEEEGETAGDDETAHEKQETEGAFSKFLHLQLFQGSQLKKRKHANVLPSLYVTQSLEEHGRIHFVTSQPICCHYEKVVNITGLSVTQLSQSSVSIHFSGFNHVKC